METENIQIDKNMIIRPDSNILYSSLVGVGVDNDEVRLILFNKRLISDGETMKIVNESDNQIILTKNSAIKLKELLNNYLNE